ncbi:MAG: helicase C-terminal domain-containing protein [Phycisphaerae bacterium]|nr:helicase C-terminal domain-containing protein [Phycisphaerae bacterium]
MIDFVVQDDFDAERIFASAGVLAAGFPAYEERDQQKQMASAVYDAFKNHSHLAVEAGTGIGKSFAYLIPAIETAKQQKCRILISTYTITLQEQLINKDIPFLARLLDNCFTAALAKGRNNFVCLRRLEFAVRKQQGLFDSDTAQLSRLNNWAKQTKDGSLSDIAFSPSLQIWHSVMSEHGNCKSRKCPHFNKCLYWRSRRRLETADIIVANHALLFSDLVLRQQGVSLLPDYRFVIIDEAHNIEHVAEEHFGLNISDRRVSFILNGLYNYRTKKGFLANTEYNQAVELVKSCQESGADFFKTVDRWIESGKGNGRTKPGFVSDCLSEPVKKLRLNLSKLAGQSTDADEQFELLRFTELLSGLETDLKNFLSHQDKGCVHWVESEKNKRKTIILRSAPIDPAENIKKCLFDEFKSVILTSATLCAGSAQDGQKFNYFAERIGLEKFSKLKLGSPFDYQRQVTMYIEPDLPEPNNPAFADAAVEKIKKYIKQTNGSAFVLFTSYQMLEQFAELLADWFRENNIELLVQGSGQDRAELLRRFKAAPGRVLFGTDSFWQGVDVPGAALSNVIIVKLPFAVPTHPLTQGRIEDIRAKGQNPFFSYQLPAAIIKFKQGFGRLIRSKTDTGIVVILDSRILNKNYGREFIAAIEKCRIEIAG